MTETVLFVCEDNSILSPMAEAFLRRHCQLNYKVYSSGIEPKPIHLLTFQVMEEIGYDIYNAKVNSIFDLNHLNRVDYLITLTDYVKNNFIFNESNIGSQLHWPFRNPLIGTAQTGLDFPDYSCVLPTANITPVTPGNSYLPESTLIKTKSIIELQVPIEKVQSDNLSEIRARFRRTRDEIEVQVMNWLEEMGFGPLWWRR
jgi:protein-tyrosine-phosphatase